MATKEFHESMKKLTAFAALLGVAGLAQAEPQRSLLTYENKMMDYHETEVGALVGNQSFDAYDITTVAGYARFGLLTNLTFDLSVPYKDLSVDGGDSESGLGDVEVGLALRAYEDIFGYPYCIPHVSAALPTGDEDKGLGAEDVPLRVGMTLGTMTWDELHWIVDFSYVANGTRGSDPQDIFMFSGGLVWDISKKFSVLVEAVVTDEDTPDDETPVFVQGGMTYKFTRNFMLGAYAGGGEGGPDNAENAVTVKGAYTF